jgi:pimeloyl-ACP methyl ester carboxylesterase
MTAAQPEDKWIDANGIKLHYLDWGNPTAPPMVLLHGFCSYAHYWDFFARSLRQEYHILVPDMRGHGDSSWTQSYTLQNSALDLEELIRALNLKDIVLIGLSMGGLISLVYAAIHPDTVSKLIIVDIGPEFAAAGIEHIQRDLANEPGIFDYEDEVFRYLKQTQPLSSDAFIKHQVKHALKRDEAGRLGFKYDKALCQTDLNSQEWLWDYLEQISCPTLVVRAADSDMLTIETAQKMVAKLPYSSLVEIPHAGHTVVGDNPEGFKTVVQQFLGARNN